MRAPTSASTLRFLISDFQSYLPRISMRPAADFDEEFHERLNLIDRLSQETPDARQELMRHCFDACALLDRSDCHRRGRHKPLGYAGDYQMIDYIYQQRLTQDSVGRIWDEFFHRQLAPRSVRNRKAFFVDLVRRLSERAQRPLSILDIASGPCRDVAEAFEGLNGQGRGAVVHCIDSDAEAIDYGSKLLKPLEAETEIVFEHCNALKFRTSRAYDLVWSAGLFDYLEDRYARILLRKMWRWTAPGGSLVVGNFHKGHAGRAYIEWCGDWLLIHRDAHDLKELARQAEIPEVSVRIEYEPLRVGIFLCAEKPNP